MTSVAFVSSPPPSCSHVAEPTEQETRSLSRRMQELLAANETASARYVKERPDRTNWLGENRHFFPEFDICMDGRSQTAPLTCFILFCLARMYRSPGSRTGMENSDYRLRTGEAIAKCASIHLGDEGVKEMLPLRFCMAHYSFSNPTTQSCAAWNHDTRAAIAAMHGKTDELHWAYPGRILALVVSHDTDRDALTFHGPGGELSVWELSHDRACLADARNAVFQRLEQIYPLNWPPLARLKGKFRKSFHRELTDYVVANMTYVQQVLDSKRPIITEHGEDLICVGRHLDVMVGDRNRLFCLDYGVERAELCHYFAAAAVPYVTRNVLRRAIPSGDRDWRIPIFVNVAYEGDNDKRAEIVSARHLAADLKATLETKAQSVVDWMLHSAHGIPLSTMPHWLRTEFCAQEISRRAEIITSCSHRSDRRFRPFT